jgi:hypothetical protein
MSQQEVPQGAFQPFKKQPMSTDEVSTVSTTVVAPQTLKPSSSDSKVHTLTVIEGFTSTPTDKQSGGRDNKQPLRRHVVNVTLPQNAQANQYLVIAKLIGKKNKVEYAEIEKLEQSGLRFSNGQWISVFDRLIIQHASHNFGQKLFIRFTLVDGFTLNPISYVDSAPFETITRRGQEKRKRKDKMIFTVVEPSTVFNNGQSVIKLHGTGFTSVPTLNPTNVLVKFGNVFSKDVFTLQENVVICQVPPLDFHGDLLIELSLDGGKSWIITGLVLKVLNGVQESKIIQQKVAPTQNQQERLPSVQELVEYSANKFKTQ